MKSALSILAVPFLLPLFGGDAQLSRSNLEHALARQMNSGRAGVITKHVSCRATAALSRYDCTLTGRNGSRAQAVVVVSADTWRADWAPPRG